MSSRASLSAAQIQQCAHCALKSHTLQFSLVCPETDSRVLFDEYLDNEVSISVSTFDGLEETRLIETAEMSKSGRACEGGIRRRLTPCHKRCPLPIR
jgi:hypothetical protein